MTTISTMSTTLPDLLPDTAAARRWWHRPALVLAGVLAVGAGLVLWALPFTPGLPLVVLGLGCIGLAIPPARRALNRWERRLPDRCRRWLRPRHREHAQVHQARKLMDELLREP